MTMTSTRNKNKYLITRKPEHQRKVELAAALAAASTDLQNHLVQGFSSLARADLEQAWRLIHALVRAFQEQPLENEPLPPDELPDLTTSVEELYLDLPPIEPDIEGIPVSVVKALRQVLGAARNPYNRRLTVTLVATCDAEAADWLVYNDDQYEHALSLARFAVLE
jgi:hypothetical protein